MTSPYGCHFAHLGCFPLQKPALPTFLDAAHVAHLAVVITVALYSGVLISNDKR